MLIVNLDFTPLAQMAKGLEDRLVSAGRREGQALAMAAHAHMIEEANLKLNSRRQKFIDGLSFKQENQDTWLIVLDRKARWIDDGLEPHEMIDDLLSNRGGKSKPKVAKDGSRYRVIPFFHGPGKGKTNSTPAEMSLQSAIKTALKQADNHLTGGKGIPYGKLERGSDGQPLNGLLHSIDINSQPKKTHNGPGQGWGRIGDVKQGATGIPFLQGLRIYQRKTKNMDGSTSTKRAIMTFRVVSSKHKGSGRWFHPGVAPAGIFDETYDWARRKWEEEILPRVIDFVVNGHG
jgi:hypothetical protein